MLGLQRGLRQGNTPNGMTRVQAAKTAATAAHQARSPGDRTASLAYGHRSHPMQDSEGLAQSPGAGQAR